MNRLFVYGSLRQGEQAHRALRDCKFLGKATLQGFDLFALTWFPGIKANPKNHEGVVGEVYELPEDKKADLIKHLDYYEGYFPTNVDKSLFVRREVEIEGEPTLVYEFNRNPYDAFGTSARVVQGGDWVKYKGELHHAA